MDNTTLSLLAASVLLGGCVAPMVGTLPRDTTVSPAGLHQTVVIRYSTMDLLAEDPAEAVGELERIIDEAGGVVSWSTAGDGYAELSAQVPSGSLIDIRLAARQIAVQILSDETSSEDVTEVYEDLVERFGQLEQAEEEIQTILASAKDPQQISSFQLVLRLLGQEKETVETDMKYYADSGSI